MGCPKQNCNKSVCLKSWLLPCGCPQAFQRPLQTFLNFFAPVCLLLLSCVLNLQLSLCSASQYSAHTAILCIIQRDTANAFSSPLLRTQSRKIFRSLWYSVAHIIALSVLLPFCSAQVQTVENTWIEKQQILRNVKNLT